jgi:hypothetical protein
MSPMDLTNDYPRLCAEVGLTCQVCTAESARQLAQVCKGLRGKMIGQLFVQLYPNSACAPMHAYFTESYRASSSGFMADVDQIPIRKPAAMAAVA